jgi:hypothetical protein
VSTAETTLHPGTRHHLSDTVNPLTVRKRLDNRGKLGTKYHVVVATDGLPLGAVPSAAKVHDTRLFPHLLHLALAVCAAIAKLYADAAYDSADNRRLDLTPGSGGVGSERHAAASILMSSMSALASTGVR